MARFLPPHGRRRASARLFRIGVVAGVGALVSSTATGEPSASSSPALENRSLMRIVQQGELTVALAPSTSVSLAVCAGRVHAGVRKTLVSTEEARSVAARGGRVWSTRERGGSLDCAAVPRGEAAFAIWLGCAWLERTTQPEPNDDVTPDTRSVERTAALLLQTRGFDPVPHRRRLLSIAGGFDETSVVPLVAEKCANPPPHVPRTMGPREPQSTERLSVMEDRRVGLPSARYGWSLRSNGDVTATLLALTLLATGDASRLGDDVVRRRRLAHAAGAWMSEYEGTRAAGLWMELNPLVTVDRAQRFLDGALKQLSLVGPSPSEVARARALWATEFTTILSSSPRLAQALAEHGLIHGDPRHFLESLVDSSSVTPAAIKRAAHDQLTNVRRAVVETYPPDWPQDDATLAGYTLHTVQAGETWTSLSRRFGIPVGELTKPNDLDPRHRPTPGEVLWVPPRTKAP